MKNTTTTLDNKKVYAVICNKTIANIFDSKEKAFNSLPQKDEFTKIYQSVRTCDDIKVIVPTVDNFYLDAPIYVYVAEHTEDMMGLPVEFQKDAAVYKIKEFKVK